MNTTLNENSDDDVVYMGDGKAMNINRKEDSDDDVVCMGNGKAMNINRKEDSDDDVVCMGNVKASDAPPKRRKRDEAKRSRTSQDLPALSAGGTKGTAVDHKLYASFGGAAAGAGTAAGAAAMARAAAGAEAAAGAAAGAAGVSPFDMKFLTAFPHMEEGELDPKSSQFAEITNLYCKSGGKSEVVKITAMHNMWTTDKHMNHEKCMVGQNPGGVNDITWLWHQCRPDNIALIWENGFDSRYYKKGYADPWTHYGHGCYFTHNAYYAEEMEYTEDEFQFILLSRVLVGVTSEGDESKMSPEIIEGTHKQVDSYVSSNGKWIVTQKDNQALLGYKVVVQRRAEPVSVPAAACERAGGRL